MSARNYWTISQLWQDWHYWRRVASMRRRIKAHEYNRWGYVNQAIFRGINAADMNAKASYDVLSRRKPGLRHPDMSAQLATEGYSRNWSRNERAVR